MPYITQPQSTMQFPQAQPQGIFGGSPQPGGIWGPVTGFLGNHSNALLQAGLGMLSGNTPQEGFGNAARGLAYGTQADQTSADRKRADADRKKLDAALQGLIGDQSPSGPMAGLSGPVRNLMAADPGFASSVLASRVGPKTDDWQRMSDGTLFKPSTGETRAVAGAKREIRNDANGVPRFTDSGEAVYPSDQSASGESGFFTGKSPVAQAINYLVKNNKMTKEQAAEYVATHYVTGPNGEIVPVTPGSMYGGAGQQQGATGGEQGLAPITGPKLPEDMRKAAGFALRATAADQIVSDPAVAAAGASLVNKGAANVPIVGNMLVPEAYQKFDQAQRDFVNAVLRRESGAAISQSEFENAQKQYFPQPGDGPDVLAQKAANRKLAIDSLNMSGQPSPTFGGSQPSPPSQGAVQLPSGGTLTPHPDGSLIWSPQ